MSEFYAELLQDAQTRIALLEARAVKAEEERDKYHWQAGDYDTLRSEYIRLGQESAALKERIAELEKDNKWMKIYVQDTSEDFEHLPTCDSYGCDTDGGCPVTNIPAAFRILRERLKVAVEALGHYANVFKWPRNMETTGPAMAESALEAIRGGVK